MKHLQRLFILLATSFAIFSCQKEYSLENGTGGVSGSAQWEFKEGIAQFKGPLDTAAVDTIGGYKFLTINGRSTDGKDQISLQVFGTELKAGTYKTPLSLFTYVRNGIVFYQTNQTAVESFTIIITKIDSTGITGTFSGQVLDSAKVVKTIVDGKFAAAFKTTIPPVIPPSTDSGQVLLWSKVGCGGGTSTSPITISLNNKSGQITKFFATEPGTCDPAGGYSVKLPVGTYFWVAKCGIDSVAGNVTVTKGGCTKTQVDFTAPVPVGDYFPTTTNSNWSYLYEASTPDDTLYVLSTGKTVTNSFGTLNLFTNDYGPAYKDSSYYKKANGSYYEYLPADTIGSVVVEHIFLKDNVAAGNTWKTATPGGVLQGLTFTGEIRDTLSQKLTSFSVGGKTYTDVLEVHSGFFLVFAAPIGAQQAYLVKQWFAKGVGLIKYYQNDLVTGSGESVINLTRHKVN